MTRRFEDSLFTGGVIFTHGDRIVHIPGMNTGFLVMKPAIAVFTPQTASSAQPYYQQPSAEIALT